MAECIARCRIWNYISYNWNYSTQVSNKDNNVQTKGLSLKTRAQNIDILIRIARSEHTRHPHYGNGWNKSNLMPSASKAHCKKGSKKRLTQSACSFVIFCFRATIEKEMQPYKGYQLLQINLYSFVWHIFHLSKNNQKRNHFCGH